MLKQHKGDKNKYAVSEKWQSIRHLSQITKSLTQARICIVPAFTVISDDIQPSWLEQKNPTKYENNNTHMLSTFLLNL